MREPGRRVTDTQVCAAVTRVLLDGEAVTPGEVLERAGLKPENGRGPVKRVVKALHALADAGVAVCEHQGAGVHRWSLKTGSLGAFAESTDEIRDFASAVASASVVSRGARALARPYIETNWFPGHQEGGVTCYGYETVELARAAFEHFGGDSIRGRVSVRESDSRWVFVDRRQLRRTRAGRRCASRGRLRRTEQTVVDLQR